MKDNEIRNYMKVLCEMTSKNLDEMVNDHSEYLPFFLVFNARSCYVGYDTQEERITSVKLFLMEKSGLAIMVDPVGGTITGFVAAEPEVSLEMQRNTADTLLACIRTIWKRRLSTEMLVTTGSDSRFITADLLEDFSE